MTLCMSMFDIHCRCNELNHLFSYHSLFFDMVLLKSLVILKSPLFLLIHLNGTLGFMFGYVFRLTNILKNSLSQIYLEVSIPNFGGIVHILYTNFLEVLYYKHVMVCFESTKVDVLNFQLLL